MPLVLSRVRAAYQSRMQIVWACSQRDRGHARNGNAVPFREVKPPVRYATMTLVTNCCENGAESIGQTKANCGS